MIIVDTDVLVDILRDRRPAVAWLSAVGNKVVAAPGYAALEVIQGARDAGELRALNRLLVKIDVIWPDAVACADALRNYNRHHLANAIGVLDVLIAHTALHYGHPLHTFNVKHYAVVPGLKTVQPYVR